jgi:hypothetical protein
MPYNYLMSEEFGASDAWTLQSAKSILDYKDGWAKGGKKGKAMASGKGGKKGRAVGSAGGGGGGPVNNAYVPNLVPGAVSILNGGRGVPFATNPYPATAYRGFVNDIIEEAEEYNEELPDEYLEIIEEFANDDDEDEGGEEEEDEEAEEVYVDEGGFGFLERVLVFLFSVI